MSQTINFANLSIQIEESADEVVFSFKGDVDENFRQQEVPRISKGTIIFELSEVVNFNSCGIREWIYLVRDFSQLGSLVFRKCSVTMIDQINMVPDSLADGMIESFYAPYYCPNHGEMNKLIVVKDAINELSQKHAPSFNCHECDHTLEFDALEESYFLFADGGFQNVS